MKKCLKCNGRGNIAEFSHIQSGICFDCDGSGVILDSSEKDLAVEYIMELEFLQAQGEQECGDSDYDYYE